jgi:hypothetical protein
MRLALPSSVVEHVLARAQLAFIDDALDVAVVLPAALKHARARHYLLVVSTRRPLTVTGPPGPGFL